jgi:predicted nucleic acid-binding protein
MANKILTFIDASILISAIRKTTASSFARRMRAHQILNDHDREFVGSEFLKLEVLPMAKFFIKTRELRFYQNFFDSIIHWAPSETLIPQALELACDHGLGALDALHLCAAMHFDAEFISAEKPTKPLYRAYSNISSIYED